MTSSCCGDAPTVKRTKVDVALAPKALETTAEQPANTQKSECCEKQAKNENHGCGCEVPRSPGAGSMTQLPIVSAPTEGRARVVMRRLNIYKAPLQN